MARGEFIYKPEGGSERAWPFDTQNPAWDLAFTIEKETGWAWDEFLEKFSRNSFVATRALVFAYRKRDEPRLSIDSVTVTNDEWDMKLEEPQPVKKVAKKAAVKGEGEA